MLSTLPPATSGLALGNIGLALMWWRLSVYHPSLNNGALFFFFHLFTAWGLLLLFICILRIILNPRLFLTLDLSTPRYITTIGTMAMAIALLALCVQTPEMGSPIEVVYFLSLLSTLLQVFVFITFVRKCIETKTLPEPYFNAALFPIAFTPIAMPGSNYFSIALRHLFLTFSLLNLITTLPVILYRLLIDSELKACPYVRFLCPLDSRAETTINSSSFSSTPPSSSSPPLLHHLY